jgi:hypothetical protein
MKRLILPISLFMVFVGCSRRLNSLPAMITSKPFKAFATTATSTKNVDSQKKDQKKIVVSNALPQGRSEQEQVEDESKRLIEKTRSNCINCCGCFSCYCK